MSYCAAHYYSGVSIGEDDVVTHEQSDYSKYDFIAPDSTFHLKYPEEIRIDEQGLVTVKGAKFSVNEIRKISLGGLGLNDWEYKDFPIEVLKFEHLEYLYLGMRGFKRIPDEITKLKHLKVLDLQHTAVEALPSNFSELKRLEELILLYSNIKKLPENISKMSSLKRLHLGCTNFDKIPTQLFKMTWLESLILTNRRECDNETLYGFYHETERSKLKAMLPLTDVKIRKKIW